MSRVGYTLPNGCCSIVMLFFGCCTPPKTNGENTPKRKRKNIYTNQQCLGSMPIGSMCGIFTYIYHKFMPFMKVNIPIPWIRHGMLEILGVKFLQIPHEFPPTTPTSNRGKPLHLGLPWGGSIILRFVTGDASIQRPWMIRGWVWFFWWLEHGYISIIYYF